MRDGSRPKLENKESRLNREVWTVLLVLVALLLVGCGATEAPPMTVVSEEPTQISEAPEAVVTEAATDATAEPTLVMEAETEPTVTVEPEPTALPPTPTPIVVVDVDSACVSCHTDVDRLKELAVEPEEVELSSGEG